MNWISKENMSVTHYYDANMIHLSVTMEADVNYICLADIVGRGYKVTRRLCVVISGVLISLALLVFCITA